MNVVADGNLSQAPTPGREEVPRVSVLVRARNDEALVGHTLEGIFAQEGVPPFEVVVCDDASTDRTREVVRRDHARAFGDGKVQATWRFFFSLASSATWRRLLLESPFDETIRYSEDFEWAWRNSRRKRNPVEIGYGPRARVEHSHNYTLRELARRFRGAGASDRAIFGDRPCLARELAGAARETLRDWAWLAGRPRGWREIPSAPVRRLVQRVAHWRGTRSGVGDGGGA